ncbi:MAG: hypothetical protein J5716_04575, partial [Alphaproteobacteria bacterium]|nr:hypothetical protein [Alphaproteobacteria bacterium]
MEKTAQQKTAQDTKDVSEKKGVSKEKAKEIKVSKQVASKIRRRWEALAKRQENGGIRVRANRKITSVSFVKDENGKVSVQVNLRNGRSIKDNAEEKGLEKFQKESRRAYARTKIEELLKKIKELGFAAVEGEIPPELKEAVLRSMAKANISTSHKGTKAQEAEARKMASNASSTTKTNFISDLNNISLSNASSNIISLNNGVLTCSEPPKGYSSYTVNITPHTQEALERGIFQFTGKEIPDHFSAGAKESLRKAVEQNSDTVSRALIDLNDKNKFQTIENVTGHLKDGNPNSAKITEDVVLLDGTKVTLTGNGSVTTTRQDAAKRALVVAIWGEKEENLTGALNAYRNDFLNKIINQLENNPDLAKHPLKGISKEALSKMPINELLEQIPNIPSLLGQISSKDIIREMKELGERYSPDYLKYVKDIEQGEHRDKVEREGKDRTAKIKQLNDALGLNPDDLSEQGLNLRQTLNEKGLKKEDIDLFSKEIARLSKESPDLEQHELFARLEQNEMFAEGTKGHAFLAILKQNESFAKGNDGYLDSCSVKAVADHKKQQEEKRRQKELSPYIKAIAKILDKKPEELTEDQKELAARLCDAHITRNQLEQFVGSKDLPPEQRLEKVTALLEEEANRANLPLPTQQNSQGIEAEAEPEATPKPKSLQHSIEAEGDPKAAPKPKSLQQNLEAEGDPKAPASNPADHKKEQKEIRKAVNAIKMEEALHLFTKLKNKEELTPDEEKRVKEWNAKGVMSLKDFSPNGKEKAKVRQVVDQISDKGITKAYEEKLNQAKKGNQ